MNQGLEEVNSYEYIININHITLHVKFPCKMYLRYQQQKITEEKTPNNNHQFIFNKEILIKDNNKLLFQVISHITTEKGGNIVAGLIKIEKSQLNHLEGQIMQVQLQNCVDSNAKCQIKIVRIKKVLGLQQKSRFRTKSGVASMKVLSKQRELYDNSSNSFLERQKIISQKSHKRPFDYMTDSFHEANKSSRLNSLQKQINNRKKSQYSRQNYRNQYDILQNNYRLDILKYKSKIEQLQKQLSDKTHQIKQLNQQSNRLKLLQYNKLYFNQEMQNKNKLLQTYENYIKELRRQNEELKDNKLEMDRNLIKCQDSKVHDVQALQRQSQKVKLNFQRDVGVLKEENQYLQFQFENKSKKIEKMKKMIEEYERKSDQIEEEYKIVLKNEKEDSRRKIQILTNQLKYNQSALHAEQITRKELQKELTALKNKFKDKQNQILILFQELHLFKLQNTNKDDLKVKLSENTRQKIYFQRQRHQSEERYFKLLEKSQNIERLLQDNENQNTKLKKQYKNQKLNNERLQKEIEELNCKLNTIKKEDKLLKTYEWQIKYIKDNEKDWRDIMRNKNQKILELTSIIEKMKKENSLHEMRYIRENHNKDYLITQMNIQFLQLQNQNEKKDIKERAFNKQQYEYEVYQRKPLSMYEQKDELKHSMNEYISVVNQPFKTRQMRYSLHDPSSYDKQIEKYKYSQEDNQKNIITKLRSDKSRELSIANVQSILKKDKMTFQYEKQLQQMIKYKYQKQLLLKQQKIRDYQKYINKYLNRIQENIEYNSQQKIHQLQQQIKLKDQIIESLNELIYQKDKLQSQLFPHKQRDKYSQFQQQNQKKVLNQSLQDKKSRIIYLQDKIMEYERQIVLLELKNQQLEEKQRLQRKNDNVYHDNRIHEYKANKNNINNDLEEELQKAKIKARYVNELLDYKSKQYEDLRDRLNQMLDMIELLSNKNTETRVQQVLTAIKDSLQGRTSKGIFQEQYINTKKETEGIAKQQERRSQPAQGKGETENSPQTISHTHEKAKKSYDNHSKIQENTVQESKPVFNHQKSIKEELSNTKQLMIEVYTELQYEKQKNEKLEALINKEKSQKLEDMEKYKAGKKIQDRHEFSLQDNKIKKEKGEYGDQDQHHKGTSYKQRQEGRQDTSRRQESERERQEGKEDHYHKGTSYKQRQEGRQDTSRRQESERERQEGKVDHYLRDQSPLNYKDESKQNKYQSKYLQQSGQKVTEKFNLQLNHVQQYLQAQKLKNTRLIQVIAKKDSQIQRLIQQSNLKQINYSKDIKNLKVQSLKHAQKPPFETNMIIDINKGSLNIQQLIKSPIQQQQDFTQQKYLASLPLEKAISKIQSNIQDQSSIKHTKNNIIGQKSESLQQQNQLKKQQQQIDKKAYILQQNQNLKLLLLQLKNKEQNTIIQSSGHLKINQRQIQNVNNNLHDKMQQIQFLNKRLQQKDQMQKIKNKNINQKNKYITQINEILLSKDKDIDNYQKILKQFRQKLNKYQSNEQKSEKNIDMNTIKNQQSKIQSKQQNNSHSHSNSMQNYKQKSSLLQKQKYAVEKIDKNINSINTIIKQLQENKYLMKLKNKQINSIKTNVQEMGNTIQKNNENIMTLIKECLQKDEALQKNNDQMKDLANKIKQLQNANKALIIKAEYYQKMFDQENQIKQKMQDNLINIQNIISKMDQQEKSKDKQKFSQLQCQVDFLKSELRQYISVIPRQFFVKKQQHVEIILKGGNNAAKKPLKSQFQQQCQNILKDQTQSLQKVIQYKNQDEICQHIAQIIEPFNEIKDIINFNKKKQRQKLQNISNSQANDIKQSIIFPKDFKIDRIFKRINKFIHLIKKKYRQLQGQHNRLIDLMKSQFQIKNQYKDHNYKLINQKADLNLLQAQRKGHIQELQSQNTRLKEQIAEIMQDYHRRIEVIAALKESLSLLNTNLKYNEQQKQRIHMQVEKNKRKMKIKQEEVQQKQGQITIIQNRYKQILSYYMKELQNNNKNMERQRMKFLKDKEQLNEQLFTLKSKINQIKYQSDKNKNEQQNIRYLMQLQNIKNKRPQNNQNKASKIQEKLMNLQQERSQQQKEIHDKNNKIIELKFYSQKLLNEINIYKNRNHKEIKQIKDNYEHQISLLNQKNQNLQSIVRQLLSKRNKHNNLEKQKRQIKNNPPIKKLEESKSQIKPQKDYYQSEKLQIASILSQTPKSQKAIEPEANYKFTPFTNKQLKLLEIIETQYNEQRGKRPEKYKQLMTSNNKIQRKISGNIKSIPIQSPKNTKTMENMKKYLQNQQTISNNYLKDKSDKTVSNFNINQRSVQSPKVIQSPKNIDKPQIGKIKFKK